MKALDQLFDAGHLRHPARTDEGANGDFLKTRVRQHIEELNLGVNRNIRALDLQTVAHAFFCQKNFRIIAHASLLEMTVTIFLSRP